jgi:hypothetical protein
MVGDGRVRVADGPPMDQILMNVMSQDQYDILVHGHEARTTSGKRDHVTNLDGFFFPRRYCNARRSFYSCY